MEPRQAFDIADQFGTPLYLYWEDALEKTAQEALSFGAPFGLTVRFAMKACPSRRILQIFNKLGIQIDASSEYEVRRAMLAGIPAKQILLTSQEISEDLPELVKQGMEFNACSLHQLETYGMAFPGTEVGIRINPGEGSGFDARVNVGGEQSGFGIWHELLPQAQALIQKYQLKVKRLHTHIGVGTDPEVWLRVAHFSLSFLENFPEATVLNLGGGFKVARVPSESSADMKMIGQSVKQALEEFAGKTGRKMHLEIEPGTFLMANAGGILARIVDKTSTSRFNFLKLDAGMTEIIRPSYYGSQHSMQVLPKQLTGETEEVVVVGHCCESADVLTVVPGHGDEAEARTLTKAEIGDLLLIEGAGAYCSGMATKNYNSFPQAAEVLIKKDSSFELIRRRETLEDLLRNEV